MSSVDILNQWMSFDWKVVEHEASVDICVAKLGSRLLLLFYVKEYFDSILVWFDPDDIDLSITFHDSIDLD